MKRSKKLISVGKKDLVKKAPVVGSTNLLHENVDDFLAFLEWYPQYQDIQQQFLAFDWKDMVIDRLWRQYEGELVMNMVEDEVDLSSGFMDDQELEQVVRDERRDQSKMVIMLQISSNSPGKTPAVKRFIRSLERLVEQARVDLEGEED